MEVNSQQSYTKMNEIPILDNNPEEEDIITPLKEYEYEMKFSEKKEYPESCFIFFQPEIMKNFIEKSEIDLIETLLGRYKFYEVKHNKKNYGVMLFGIGAPLSALLIERLIVRKIKKFITIGISGSLCGGNVGDICLCKKAIRDEGVSYHYKKASKYVEPSIKLNEKIKEKFKLNNITFIEGISWTTDAGYKESKLKAKKYREEGVTCIDMESASLFAIAEHRKVDLSSVFIMSDFVDENFDWNPQFHKKEICESVKKIKESLISAILE